LSQIINSMSNATSLIQIVVVRSFPRVLAGLTQHVVPDVLTKRLLRRAWLHLRFPTINARPDGYILLTDIAVDLNVISLDFTIDGEIIDGDPRQLRKPPLLIKDTINGPLEMITGSPHDVVVGHRSSVRIEPDR